MLKKEKLYNWPSDLLLNKIGKVKGILMQDAEEAEKSWIIGYHGGQEEVV